MGLAAPTMTIRKRRTFLFVSGSRSIEPDSATWRRVQSLVEAQHVDTIIVQGGAQGADTAAHLAAQEHERDEMTFNARWKRQQRSAGPRRNERMLKFASDMFLEGHTVEVHCFFLKGAKNIGTQDAFDTATAMGLTTVRHGGRHDKV